MKFYIKTILIIVLFLFPFSIDSGLLDYFQGNTSLTDSSTIISLNSNTAYAINLNCDDLDFSCGISEGILDVWEILWFYTSQIALVLVGIILDIFVFMSIDGQFYRGGMIEAGWEILRDFTNIVFIFSLLVISFKIVLDAGSQNAKKVLVKTILIALTVNFSLFMALTVIDASNLLAHVFYNRIDAQGGYNSQTLDPTSENATSLSTFITQFVDKDTKSISLAIAGNVNPQLIITGNASQGFLESFIIITAAGLVNIMLLFIYIKMIAVFLGRTLGLLFSSILSAVAFVSLTIPGMENKPYVGFNTWLKELISTAMMAPVFLFFIYLAVTFLKDKGFLASMAGNPGDGTLSRILTVFVPFLIIGGILMLAKKISEDMVGSLGKAATDGIGKMVGGTIAAASIAATGGAALAGGVARGAGAIAAKSGNTTIKNIGNKTRNLGRGLQSTNFNFGQSRLGKLATKTTGIDTGAGMGNISYMGAENKAFLGAAKLKESAKDFKEGRGTKEMEAKYESDKAKIKKDSGSWQDKIHESKASEELGNISEYTKKSINPNPYAAGKSYQEHLDETRKEVNTTANQATIKSEKEQVSILEEILKAEKEKLSTDVANAAPADKATVQAAGIATVNTAKANLETYTTTTIEGKFKRAEKDLEKSTKAEFETYASTIETSGENGGKKTANKIRAGKIKPQEKKEEEK